MTRSAGAPRWQALKVFLQQEAVAGIVLLVASAAALIWANSSAGDSYTAFWHHEVTFGWSDWAITEDRLHWVNDLLMALFFFVVGLEIKRELAVGELRTPRAAALPVMAALGGVAVPAVIYLMLAPGGEATRGWGVPMATDIAFAVGVLALLGARAAPGAKLLLLSIAIVDDILAIIVIAAVYTDSVSSSWLAVAVGVVLVIVGLRRWFASPWIYVLPGLVLWLAVFESGVHATLAGVALGLLTPAGLVRGRPLLETLEHRLHPLSAFLVVPIFALANAGVDLRGGVLGEALRQPLTWAVAVGLVVGKFVGIAGVALLARRLGWGELPSGTPTSQVWPVAALGGIGFTVALFIADLAFEDPALIVQAKVGIFVASLTAAVFGLVLLWLVTRRAARSSAAEPV